MYYCAACPYADALILLSVTECLICGFSQSARGAHEQTFTNHGEMVLDELALTPRHKKLRESSVESFDLFEQIDANNDGVIDAGEFNMAIQDRMIGPGGSTKRASGREVQRFGESTEAQRVKEGIKAKVKSKANPNGRRR